MPVHTRTPTTSLGRGKIRGSAHIDLAIARLRNASKSLTSSKSSPPKKASSAAPRGGHYQGPVRGPIQMSPTKRGGHQLSSSRGDHQQGPLNRPPPVQFNCDSELTSRPFPTLLSLFKVGKIFCCL